jgi:serine/threonine protein kinase
MMTAEQNTGTHRRIGRYRVLSRIGKGGMGMVYRAYDETLEREIAIKTLTAEGILDAESRQRFEIEAKAVARMQHPNIITVFELGEDRGIPFIAMELLPGTDLEMLLRSGETLLLEEKVGIVIQVCRGLAYAHERGIIHRDIKPSNIRILDDGTIKIMDFGVAKLGGMNLTKSGMMVGTLHYMSPEQIRGLPLDGRSDVFSLGVILHELLAGERPFRAEGSTEVLFRIVNDPPPRLPEDGSGTTPELQAIVDHALAKDREARYGGAMPFAEALQGVTLAHKGPQPTPEDLENLQASKKLLQEGGFEEGVRRLEELLARNPSVIDARRTLRIARRRRDRNLRGGDAGDTFPELDQTFSPPPTQMQPGTLVKPTVALPHKDKASPWFRLLLGAGALLAVALGVLLLSRRALPVRVRVQSRPPGAAVLLDGKETGLTTDGELSLPPKATSSVTLGFRKAGYREESRTLTLPLAAEGISVDLLPVMPGVSSANVTTDPAGASVALDGQGLPGVTPLSLTWDPSKEHRVSLRLEGFEAQELHFAAGKLPQEVHAAFAPQGIPGSVWVSSTFPVDILWRGKVVAREGGQAKVSLPAGRQTVTLVSAAYFLRKTMVVDVKSGETASIEAPGLGRISIRANPDNCQVFIDGAFVDYPPILDKALAAGEHSVSFKWPDGLRREEPAQVTKGRLVYVTGRRD